MSKPMIFEPCSQCKSQKIIDFLAKCSDLSWTQWWDGKQQSGYVPSPLGIGGGDYVEFMLCTNCGQIQDYKFGE